VREIVWVCLNDRRGVHMELSRRDCPGFAKFEVELGRHKTQQGGKN